MDIDHHRRLTPYIYHIKDRVPIILFAPHVQKLIRYAYAAIIDTAWEQGQGMHIAAAWMQLYVMYRWQEESSFHDSREETWYYDGCATEAFEYEIARYFRHVLGCLSIVHKLLSVRDKVSGYRFKKFLHTFVRTLERKSKVDLSHNARGIWRAGGYEMEILTALQFDIPFISHTVFSAYEEFVGVGCTANHRHRHVIESIIHDTYALDPTLHVEVGKEVVATAVYVFAKHHLDLRDLDEWEPPDWLRSPKWDAMVHIVVQRMYRLARPNSFALFYKYIYFQDVKNDDDIEEGELVTVNCFM
jgi:hypothetical protein